MFQELPKLLPSSALSLALLGVLQTYYP